MKLIDESIASFKFGVAGESLSLPTFIWVSQQIHSAALCTEACVGHRIKGKGYRF